MAVSPRGALRKGSAWRKRVRDLFIGGGHAVVVTPTGMPGDDLDVRLVGPVRAALSVECKAHNRLDLAGWLAQAERNAGPGRVPVVVAKRVGKAEADDAYVVMSGRAFVDLLARLTDGAP